MVAALIYPAYIIYFISLLLGLISLRNISLRESLQLIFGLLAPLFLCFVLYQFSGHSHMITSHFLDSFAFTWNSIDTGSDVITLISTYFKPVFFSMLIISSIVFNDSIKKKKKYDVIKKIELLYWMLLLTLPAYFFVASAPDPQLVFVLMAAPLAIVTGLIMESDSNKILKEFFFILIIAAFFVFQLKDGFEI